MLQIARNRERRSSIVANSRTLFISRITSSRQVSDRGVHYCSLSKAHIHTLATARPASRTRAAPPAKAYTRILPIFRYMPARTRQHIEGSMNIDARGRSSTFRRPCEHDGRRPARKGGWAASSGRRPALAYGPAHGLRQSADDDTPMPRAMPFDRC